jgi:ribosome-binding ATPase YchF (GTP1/OBG family)
MEIGLTGKANSGKSSFFKAATMVDVEIASRPFTTIKPNIGIGYVIADCVDKQYGVKCKPNHGKCENGKRFIPVKLWDVAGIVPEAHLGKGLGLQFLDDIRQASVLIQIVDVSGLTDAEGKPTDNYDPCQEIAFVEKEIDSWFAGIIRKGLEKYAQKSKIGKVNILDILTEQLSGLGITKEQINEVMRKFGIENIERFAFELRKISKPIIIAANKIDLENSEKNLERMKREYSHLTIIPTSAASEIALKNAHQKGLIEYVGNDFVIRDKTKLDKKQIEGL